MSIPQSLQVLTTIRDFIRWGTSEFLRNELTFGHGFASAFDEARYLSLHALALPYDWPDDYLDTVLTPPEREQVIDILRLRVNSRQPAAYITRESWFCGLKFYVDELDALEVTRTNLELHDLVEAVTLYESDLFDSIPVQQFDVIVCNPPYVDAADMAQLSDEFRYEPEIGLAAGNDGLLLVDRILARAGEFLSDHGVLFVEVGNTREAMESTFDFLPMTWVEFEFGGGGVCCIGAQDLKQQQPAIMAIAS